MSEPKKIKIKSVIGYSGNVPDGLHVHPDGEHIIFPLGSTIVVRGIKDPSKNLFLKGHSDKISCIAVSPSGRYLASGQRTHMGFQADIIIWDYESMAPIHRMTLHKVQVQALAFSNDESFLASLGGQDDNQLVIWDVETGKALCGSTASNDVSLCAGFFNKRSDKLITAGKYTARVWEIDLENRKLSSVDCNLGNLQRVVNCLCIDEEDNFAYCGTGSGDVMQIQLNGPHIMKKFAPQKTKFSLGVLSVCLSRDGDLVVGGGDGTVAVMRSSTMKIARQEKVAGGVTSVAVTVRGETIFAGTNHSNVYTIQYETLKAELRSTCHYEKINDVAFPIDYEKVFATCSIGDIRLWNSETCAELVRIQVPNLECNCVCFSVDGKAVLSGWSDGKVRAFGPKSGKLLWVINDAHTIGHQKRFSGPLVGVTAVCPTNCGTKLLTGGSDGQVRVWNLATPQIRMIASMKEHKATINSIIINKEDTEFISACDDGSCILWDMGRCSRNNILTDHTYFKSVCYFPDESQILTGGTDKKIVYWDAVDGSAIREMEASTGEINSIHISPSGTYFASGGSDKILKLWDYDEGEAIGIGVGHSGDISSIRFSPSEQFIVSVGNEAGVFLWEV